MVGSVKPFYFWKSDVSANQGHPRSLILVPIESAFLTSYYSVTVTLVLSCAISEILQVFGAPDPAPIPPQFWGCSGCTRSHMLGSMWAGRYLMLFGREIVFEVLQPMWKTCLNIKDGRTDKLTYCGITALCRASSSKKIFTLNQIYVRKWHNKNYSPLPKCRPRS